jgi:hypothetical protein
MKNRKFIGKDSFEATGWDIQTYISKILDNGKLCFWAEFSYSNGHHTFNLDLDQAKAVATELTKFINEASIKEHDFKEKQKKAKK